jgi:uncharacterized membrane protein YphA (DoxX/SURF4 family)
MQNAKKYGTWIVMTLVALILFAAGGGKLAGVPELHKSFEVLGLPAWFGYFIGTSEIAGAIGLFIRPLSALAAVGIAIIMLGAAYFHLTYTPIAQGLPALLVLLASVYIFTQRKASLLKFK